MRRQSWGQLTTPLFCCSIHSCNLPRISFMHRFLYLNLTGKSTNFDDIKHYLFRSLTLFSNDARITFRYRNRCNIKHILVINTIIFGVMRMAKYKTNQLNFKRKLILYVYTLHLNIFCTFSCCNISML